MVKHVNKEEFENILKDSALPVVCDFWAMWCGPCRMLAPVLDELSAEYADKAVFVKVDIDDNEELAVKYGIHSIPDVIIFRNGEVVDSNLGFMPKAGIKAFLDKNL